MWDHVNIDQKNIIYSNIIIICKYFCSEYKIFFARRDEHSLIAVYCQKLQEGQLASLIPDSPMQVAVEIDAEQRKELEFMIKWVSIFQ